MAADKTITLNKEQVTAAAAREQEQQEALFERWKSERKVISDSLTKLRDASFEVAATRERVPQPLFWSVFHCEINALKKRREKQRAMARTLFKTE